MAKHEVKITSEEVYKLFTEIGVRTDLNGFNYLIEAVKIGHLPIGQIYKKVAEMYGTTPSRVERCIRYAVSDFCETVEDQEISLKIEATIGREKVTLPNKAFIREMYNHFFYTAE